MFIISNYQAAYVNNLQDGRSEISTALTLFLSLQFEHF